MISFHQLGKATFGPSLMLNNTFGEAQPNKYGCVLRFSYLQSNARAKLSTSQRNVLFGASVFLLYRVQQTENVVLRSV